MWIDFNAKQPKLNSEIRVKFSRYVNGKIVASGELDCTYIGISFYASKSDEVYLQFSHWQYVKK